MSETPIREYSSLHGHSHFSLGDGLSTPEENIVAAKAKGLRSITLSDHGSCHGHADHYLFGKKHGVRTVFGTEAYVIHSLKEWNALKEKAELAKKAKGKSVVVGAELDEAAAGVDAKLLRKKGHLVLNACNRNGLANLNQLVYEAFRDGFYGKPRMDKDMLRAHSAGLMASSACMGGVISKVCWEVKDGRATWDEAVQETLEFDAIFGRGRFFLEIQLNEHEGQRFINECMVRLHNETGVPLTVTTDFHYSREEEWEAREVLHLVMAKKTVVDTGGKIDTDIKQLYIKSADEMWQTYLKYGASHIEPKVMIEAFQNTLLMDSLVEDFEPDTAVRLPSLPYEDPFQELGLRAIAGLKKLGLVEKDQYREQLLHELRVIREKGFSNYFIIVQDMVREAKKTQWVGAGRGSAGGSLVCYALGITDLDPIKYDLMFERFLDPSRADLPDIDIDFEDVGATKEMLRKLYGADNVACLSVYGTYQIKGLLKDLARVFNLDHNAMNKVNQRIQSELRALYGAGEDKSSLIIKLEDIKRVSPAFNNFVSENPQVGGLVEKLYGRNRHVGRHASGVVIGDNLPRETSIFMATDRESGERIAQTSFTEGIVNKNLGAMGLVKFDILSITTLKVIRYAVELVAKRTGKTFEELRESLRPHNMDMSDPKVLKHVFWQGNTCGVFQFTGKGITRLAQRVQPESFDDVSAVVSLYRPGALNSGMHKIFLENKQNPDAITYEHPIFEQLLKRSRGALIYQEQLMKMCQFIGKMALKDVQRIRKNLLKKIKGRSEEFLRKENEELSGKFIEGFVQHGFTEERAKQWWQNTLAWGGYGFNASHSYDYSVMTMQCAHLATYHPVEFYAAVLTKGQSEELQDYVSGIQKTGNRVLPVDVNKSSYANTIERDERGDAIRLALSSVLGVGPAAIAKIVAGQPYSDFRDFLKRSGVGKTAIEPLIQVGAFGSLYQNTKDLEEKYADYCANPKWKTKKLEHEWDARWDAEPVEDYRLHEKVFFENALTGFSLRGSPFEILDRDKKIEAICGENTKTYKDVIEADWDEEENEFLIPVVLKEFKERAQRNSQMMAFLKFGVQTGEEFEVACFAQMWKHLGPKMKKGAVYIGTFNKRADDEAALMLGRQGWGHRVDSILGYLVNLDDVEL